MLVRAFVVNAFGFMCFEIGKKIVYSNAWMAIKIWFCTLFLYLFHNITIRSKKLIKLNSYLYKK